MNPETRTTDYLTQGGASQLAEIIIAYWIERGHEPPTIRLEPIDGSDGFVAVRSNLTDRLPRRAR